MSGSAANGARCSDLLQEAQASREVAMCQRTLAHRDDMLTVALSAAQVAEAEVAVRMAAALERIAAAAERVAAVMERSAPDGVLRIDDGKP